MSFKPGEVDQVIGKLLAQHIVLKYLLQYSPAATEALRVQRPLLESSMLALAVTDAQIAETKAALDALLPPLPASGSGAQSPH